jgi:hypothetical protein
VKLANRDKLKKDDRILIVKLIDGELPLSSIGKVDKRLFQGGNHLHAFYSSHTGLWKLRYEKGDLPFKLQDAWPTFDTLYAATDKYLRTRNLYIEQVLD